MMSIKQLLIAATFIFIIILYCMCITSLCIPERIMSSMCILTLLGITVF